MPRESLGFVRMVWICPNCQSKNPGNFRFCRGCGAPQPADVQFQQDDQQVLITDEKELAQARQGADAHCGFCGARNPSGEKACISCGADMATGKPRASGQVVGAFKTEAAPDSTCPNCGTQNPANATNCKGCGAPLALRPAAPPTQAARAFPTWLIFVLAGCLILSIVMLLLFTRTSESSASVARASWQRSIAVEALQPVQRSDWQQNIPGEAEMGQCEERLYTTSDSPSGDNSRKVCGTPYSVDKGNGYSEVVQDCQYEIYEPYCSYKVMEWTVVDTIVESGTNDQPNWPRVQLLEEQRAGNQNETYEIVFIVDGQEKVFRTTDIGLYEQAQQGSKWTLEINSLGSIVGITPAE